jgi:hypothetical protein
MSLFIGVGVPAGSIRSMDEIFETDIAQSMVREEVLSEKQTKRVTSIAFRLES